MIWLILFVFGLAIGSFLNVVAVRYDGERFMFDASMIGGRSHCPHCKRTLRWFELVPLASYLLQGGRCRRCKAHISIQYPIVELLSGLVFALVPLRLIMLTASDGMLIYGLSAFFIVMFEALLVMSLIDIRMGIIPDELNIFLLVLGIFFGIFMAGYLGPTSHSLLGSYSSVFGAQSNLWLNRVTGALFGGLFFGGIILVTRGKGMGMGDLKLAVPLGLFFGWPDIFIIALFAFVIGAAVGLCAITFGKKTMNGALPFGPFFAAGAAVVFFWGLQLFSSYFSLLGFR